ncbi:sigma intracellular receptor 2-like [Macadamia integrifolia]|uniref:sigma intracellular receptor 2-like n=1 Tax=Macadamia integrifolia TaxID=60698 RepID=UPI001C4FF6D0|nr:sigma intracellular receptor 2-like [Macadamia integrifolia]
MGLCKLVDAILFLFFLVIAVVVPLLDSQTCLPAHLFPDFLIDLGSWYAREYGDYLLVEKPDFFVGLIWLELILQWPLSIANLYAIISGKSWFKTTCLIYGVSTSTSMVAILGEMIGSRKASDKLLMMYSPFLGFAVLAVLRGLVPSGGRSRTPTSTNATRAATARKKRA